jgi:fructose-bisphosphate aldolase class II
VPKIIDLDLLERIRQAIPCQISLHGGSGTPLEYFEKAAQIGVSKININSDMRYAFRTTLEKVLAENPNEYAIIKIMPPVYDAIQAVVEEKLSAFGSAGRRVI